MNVQPSSSNEDKGNIVYRTGHIFAVIAYKLLPDALVFAVGLSIVVFIGGLFLTDSSFLDMIKYWGDGVWNLLEFAMQVVLTLITSHILAHTKPVARLLDKAASIPKTPAAAVMAASLVTMIGSLLSWGFGLILGALYTRAIARKMRGIDYPILVASAYSGFLAWHGGLSGTVPLTLATPGSWTEPIIHGTMSISQTMLSPLNLALVAFSLVSIPLLVRLLLPPADKVREIDPVILAEEEEVKIVRPENPTLAQKMEYSRVPSTIMGLVLAVYLIGYFARNGVMGLNLNTVNMCFFSLGLMLVNSPIEYVKRTAVAATGAGNLIIQFPLYAGIMGMMVSSGMAAILSNFFVSIATQQTLPNILHLISAILNMFIPSGGGQFAVEAPIYLPAAEALGAPIHKVAMGCAWGDALTNLIQPFWALPMLAIAKLGIRDIMGYCAIATIFGFTYQQIFLALF